jgi:hypothetical protein
MAQLLALSRERTDPSTCSVLPRPPLPTSQLPSSATRLTVTGVSRFNCLEAAAMPDLTLSASARVPRSRNGRRTLYLLTKFEDEFGKRPFVASEAFNHGSHHDLGIKTFDFQTVPSRLREQRQEDKLSAAVTLAEGVDRV